MQKLLRVLLPVLLSAFASSGLAQVLYGPTVANSLVGGVISGPNAYPPQADTLVMTNTVAGSTNSWVVQLQTAPTTTGPWTTCETQTVTGGSGTATVSSQCKPVGGKYYQVLVTAGAPLVLNLVSSTGVPFILSAPRGAIFVPGAGVAGLAFISDAGNNRILEYNANTGFTTDLGIAALLGSALNNPGQVAQNNNADVYIADTGNNRIVDYSITNNTASVLNIGTPGGLTLSAPDGVAGHPNLVNVQIADTGNNRLITWNGTTASVTALGGGTLSSPHGLDVDSSGNYYIADTGNNRFVELAPTPTFTPIATTGYPLSGPLGAGIYQASTFAYVLTDSGHNRALEIINGTTTVPIANLNVPGGLTLNDPNQINVKSISGFSTMLIADTGNNRIVSLQFPQTGGAIASAVLGYNSLLSQGGGGGGSFVCDLANNCASLNGENVFTEFNTFDNAQIDQLADSTGSYGQTGKYLGNIAGEPVWEYAPSPNMAVVAPSGDTAGNTDTAAITNTCASTHAVQLINGLYYIGGGNTGVSIPESCRIIGIGKATVIQNEGTTNDWFRFSYYTDWVESPWAYPTSTDQSELAWMQFQQDPAVTPTAGYIVDIGSAIGAGGGTYHYTMNVHVHDTVANNAWGGAELQTDELYAFIEHNMWRNFVGGGAIFHTAEIGSGDNHIDNNEFSGLTYSGIIITQSDTTSYVSDKLNGSGISFTGAGPVQSVRFVDLSVETGISQPCAFDFGTGLPPTNVQIIGMEEYGFATTFCHPNNALHLGFSVANQVGSSDVPYGLYTNNGWLPVQIPPYQDVASFAGSSGTLLSAYTTSAGNTFSLYTNSGTTPTMPQLSGSGSAVLPAGSDSSFGDVLDTLTPLNANYTVSVTCKRVGGNPNPGLFARANNSGNNNYAVQFEPGGSVFHLYAQSTGGGSVSLAFAGFTWPVGASETMTLSTYNNQIYASIGNVVLGPISDSTWTAAGQAGLRMTGGSDVTCTNFTVQ